MWPVLAAALCIATPAAAQQRPLVTEDPEIIGAGLILLEGGFDYGQRRALSGVRTAGQPPAPPTLGVSFGISSIAELQIDGGFYNRLAVTHRGVGRRRSPDSSISPATRTHDVEDIVLATKIRIVGETAGHPAFGLRFATRLPNAGNESGLGLDTTDFHAQVLVGKTVQSIRFVGNVGLGILGDPTRGDNQNDVLDYGFSVARAVREGIEVVGEINGRANTRSGTAAGREPRAARVVRVGGRLTRGTVRIDAGILLGITSAIRGSDSPPAPPTCSRVSPSSRSATRPSRGLLPAIVTRHAHVFMAPQADSRAAFGHRAFGVPFPRSAAAASRDRNRPRLRSRSSSATWGPAAAGRIATVAGVPGDPNTYYLGSASGGVWKSTDAGQTFLPIFDDQPVAAIGAIAVGRERSEHRLGRHRRIVGHPLQRRHGRRRLRLEGRGQDLEEHGSQGDRPHLARASSTRPTPTSFTSARPGA